MSHKHPHVFLDIEIDGEDSGRVIIELFADKLPKTCENFRALCTGEKSSKRSNNKKLCFKGALFHRIIPHFMVQSGDITTVDGPPYAGGDHIYENEYFADEGFFFKHDIPGMVSMANNGPNTNKSQFFITTNRAPHLDGKHVAFGKVVKGLAVVRNIEDLGTMEGEPTGKAIIADCGQLTQREVDKVHCV